MPHLFLRRSSSSVCCPGSCGSRSLASQSLLTSQVQTLLWLQRLCWGTEALLFPSPQTRKHVGRRNRFLFFFFSCLSLREKIYCPSQRDVSFPKQKKESRGFAGWGVGGLDNSTVTAWAWLGLLGLGSWSSCASLRLVEGKAFCIIFFEGHLQTWTPDYSTH